MSWTRAWPGTVRRKMLDPEAECALCQESIREDEALALDELTGEVRHPECVDEENDEDLDDLTNWGEEGYAWQE